MNTKITVTDLQRKPGEIMMRIIRGEEIILTRNGKDFARLVPIETHPKHLYRPRYHGKLTNIRDLTEEEPTEQTLKDLKKSEEDVIAGHVSYLHKCEAPTCRSVDTQQYLVEYVVDEGLEKRKVWLCPYHVKQTREAGQSITLMIQP